MHYPFFTTSKASGRKICAPQHICHGFDSSENENYEFGRFNMVQENLYLRFEYHKRKKSQEEEKEVTREEPKYASGALLSLPLKLAPQSA